MGTDRLNLVVVPDYGARVVSLTDRSTGRQWLVTGPKSANTGECAIYGAEEAVGWDECFPTVLGCSHPAWSGRLRDHGALWGRKWMVGRAERDCIETYYETPLFRFSRRLTARGATVTAQYGVTNLGTASLPYQWSQHCLLATKPGERIVLQGQGKMAAGNRHFDWPSHPDRDLSAVGSITEGFALMAYSETRGSVSAAVLGPDGGIRFDWDDLPGFGLWLCYGGWPRDSGVHQVAFEPTTSPADHLAAAEMMGHACTLGPDDTHQWSIRMSMTGTDETASL